ncbi:MAG TPA: flagellar hook-basal body protein [Ramlibacter sp.]|nr:flagellar hook-basal body protein [Ramlibacter sp.]
MDEVLAISLHAMKGDMARLDQIAMNIANGLTPGFKRGVVHQGAQQASFAAHLNAALADPAAGPTAGAVTVSSDMRVGSLKATGQKLDVALAGKGYFEVMTDAGPAYTRQGNFRIDAQGRLVTQQGHPVLGHGGEILLQLADPIISAAGEISSAGGGAQRVLARLKVVTFADASHLQNLGKGLHAAGPGAQLAKDDEVQVRQGFLENSNVNSSQEMTSLVQTMRHFESMQKIAQGYDEMLGTAIRKLTDNS